jgi:hypothetical protein
MSILHLCLSTSGGPTLFHHQYVITFREPKKADDWTPLAKHLLPAHSA